VLHGELGDVGEGKVDKRDAQRAGEVQHEQLPMGLII
jgi:hypothetical protein